MLLLTFSLSESNSSSSIEITVIAELTGCKVSITLPGKRLLPSIFASSNVVGIVDLSDDDTEFNGSSSLSNLVFV